MEREHTFEELLEQASSGRLTRRDVLRRSLALGLSSPAIAALLAACGATNSVSARLPALKNFEVTHTQLQPEFVNMWLDES